MLDLALKFQKAFERLEEDDSEFVTNLDDGTPTSKDWSKAHVLVKFLRIFYNATRKLSGSLCYLYLTSRASLSHSLYFEWVD